MQYLRDDIKKFLPNIFGLLYEEPDWITLTNKVNNYKQTSEDSYIDCNLYEIISGAKMNDLAALAFLEYFDIVFREICNLPDYNRRQLNAKALILLNELSANFKHYIGEFAVLDSTIKTGKYELVQIEAPIGNGKSAEYLFKEIETEVTYLVEVLNIKLNESHENLRKVIRRKLVHKVNIKKSATTNEILVIPVVWAKRSVLKKLNEAYNDGFKVKYTYEPYALSIEPNTETGEGEYRFWGITRLFNG